MCRLVGWTGTAPRSAAAALGVANLEAFVQLGCAHRDGWGAAWWPPEEPGRPSPTIARPTVRHATTAAGEDPEFRRTLQDAVSDAGIVHLRWATPGLPVIVANCHPFVRGGLAMAHNGGIYPLDRVGEILPPQWEAQCEGTTDSERYVLAVVADLGGPVAAEAAGIDERTSVPDALAAVVGRLFSGWEPSSLNAVCLTADEMIAVCAYSPAPRALPEPPDIYYGLSWRADDEGVLVASSGIDQRPEDGWTRLDNMTMLIAPRSGGRPEIRALGVPVPQGRTADPAAVR
jgi:predicted glutamine amidotransferase